MTVKIIKSFNDGRVEPNDIDEFEFSLFDDFTKTFETMLQNNCHTLIIELDEGNVLYTLRVAKP